MPRLQNKTALITGGARGIGAAISRAFRDEGADVILTDINAEAGQALADEIGATFARLDVASEADWNTVAERFTVLDVLVNNAGITGFEGPFDGAPPAHDPENAALADWRNVHAVNTDGTFLGCRIPGLDNGPVVNVYPAALHESEQRSSDFGEVICFTVSGLDK